MTEDNIAYFANNNPFAGGDVKKKYDFIFRFVYSEYNVNRQYRFNIREDETIHNLIDKIASFVGKSIKINKEQKEKKEKEDAEKEKVEKDEVVFLDRNKIKFFKNGKVMNYNMCFNIFNDLQDEVHFEILSITYKILINHPIIINLELPPLIFTNFPLYPSLFDSVLVDIKKSEYIWYKSPDKIKWTILSHDYSYTPSNSDINHYLKLECVPKFETKVGAKFESMSTEKISVFPHVCPFETRHKSTQTKLSGKNFRIVSYNILSDMYIKKNYSYCPDYALNFDYRKQLILKELKDYKADIICLQETDYKIYKNFLREEMSNLNYKSFYDPKQGKAEGVSFFYHSPRFSLIRKNSIVIAKELERNKNMLPLWNKIKQNEAVAKRLMGQNTVCQVVVLISNNKNNEILVIGNTHLFYHPEAKHIRLLQIAICDMYIQNVIHQIRRQHPRDRISLLFCGDLNSQPTSGVYEFFTKGSVNDNCPDWSELPDEIVKNITLIRTKTMESAYGAPKYTNYTEDFQACLDYIFYETKYVQLTQVVPILTEEEMKKHTALPSVVVPSDHVALIADFKWK